MRNTRDETRIPNPANDSLLADELRERLSRWIDREEGIALRIDHGVVTLAGELDSFYAVQLAICCAKQTPGVMRIVNRLQVRAEAEGARTE